MTKYASFFLHPPAEGEKTARLLFIQSHIPIGNIVHEPTTALYVARLEPGGLEVYGASEPDHRGITQAWFLRHETGQLPPDRRSIFIPFVPVAQAPGEFHSISKFISNPRLDRLKFSDTGDEVTLNRFHAYGPEPEVLGYRRIWRAGLLLNHFISPIR